MTKDAAKRRRKAARGAKRAGKFAVELRAKLDRYRLDDRSSVLVDRVLQSIEELRRYEQELADRPAAEAAPGSSPKA